MSGNLDRRLSALAEAVELADGRLEPEAVAAARAVVARAGTRLGLGVETTVVALAGPTGAGKSTLFNALAGAELTTSGVRRPTTSSVTAAVRGDVNPDLLDWLGARTRHAIPPEGGQTPVRYSGTAVRYSSTARSADSALQRGSDPGRESDPGRGRESDPGFVLLDLPDYDSVESAHREEVDRVIELVDLLVWVVDPQKYADAALHDGYLRRLARYGEVMVVVLNQADRLAPAGVDAATKDLRRLLEVDGLPKVPVLAASATGGTGVPALQELLRKRASERAAAVRRLEADVAGAADGLHAGCEGKPGGIGRSDRAQLVATLADAAGVPVVVRAVAASHRRKGALAAGWPVARWLKRLRPDPLKRLRLGTPDGAETHTSLPRATPVQHSQVSSAARTLAASAAGELPPPWPGLARAAATRQEEEMPERLDRAVAGTDLKLREPRWWAVAGLLQKALALAAAAGALWLLVLVGLGYLQLEDAVPLPDVEGFPLPTLLLAGGVLLGLLLAIAARWANGIGSRRRARIADRSLRKRVEVIAEELVVSPVEAELDARAKLCDAISRSRR